MGKVQRVRLGGRSARIQEAVHEAVEALAEEVGRGGVTVPLIATRAGVPPSTIYRRWGGLPELLADVAVHRLRPATEPLDTGSLDGDLRAWAEQYLEEMSSAVGRAMIRDVVSDSVNSGSAGLCASYVEEQLQVIADRTAARGEPQLDIAAVLDLVVAPIIYRTLFGRELDTENSGALVDRYWQVGTSNTNSAR